MHKCAIMECYCINNNTVTYCYGLYLVGLYLFIQYAVKPLPSGGGCQPTEE